jgi:hypothetical protein
MACTSRAAFAALLLLTKWRTGSCWQGTDYLTICTVSRLTRSQSISYPSPGFSGA